MHERQSTLEADGRSVPEADERVESVENAGAAEAVGGVPRQGDRSQIDGALADDAVEGGGTSVLTRILLVAVIILGAGAAGYGASRIWPLPTGWIWTPPAWSVPPQEAKTFSRRTRPERVMPRGPVRTDQPASTARNSSHEAVLGQTTLNAPVKTESGPAPTEAVVAPAARAASAGTVHEAPSDATLQDDAASQKRSWRATREQARSRGTPRLADSVPSGGRQDAALRSFMATPNNF